MMLFESNHLSGKIPDAIASMMRLSWLGFSINQLSAQMVRFAQIDSQIRANGLILAHRFRVPELNPFFVNRASGGLKIANRRF